MSDTNGKDPFELEPEEERPEKARPLPPVYDDPPEPVEASDVDARTVAERRGEELPVGATEALDTPPGWPREVLGFPLRKPGPGFLLFVGGTLFALDLLVMIDQVRWLGWALQIFAMLFIVRAMFRVIGSSAAGRDEPVGWVKALEFDADDLFPYLRTIAWLVMLLVPGLVLLAFDQTGLGWTWLVLGSMYSSVVALGAGLGDASIRLPWNALRWITTRPLHCLVGSLGWWALLQPVVTGHGAVAQVLSALCLRAVGAWLLLVSARVIGVMGRSWTAA